MRSDLAAHRAHARRQSGGHLTDATEAKGDFACTFFVSDNLQTIFGYAPEEMTTDPKHWPANSHPQDAPQVIDKVSA